MSSGDLAGGRVPGGRAVMPTAPPARTAVAQHRAPGPPAGQWVASAVVAVLAVVTWVVVRRRR